MVHCVYIHFRRLLLPNGILPGAKQQIQNSYGRAVVKAAKSCHITHILRSLHWVKTTERIDYTNSSHSLTKFSQPPILYICITTSLFNLLAALALHLSLPSFDHQHHPRYVGYN